MTDLSPETEALLRRAPQIGRDAGSMPAARRRQLKSAVLARVAVASTTVAAAPAAAAAFGGAAKVVVGLAVAVTAGVGSYRALRPHAQVEAPAPIVVAAPPVPEPVVEPIAPPPTVVAEAPAPRAPAPVRHARHVEAATPADSIAAETALLREADRTLRDGDPNGALVLLERHRHKFPNGTLAPEREAAIALAHCQLGDEDEGLAYVAKNPSSPLAARLRAACKSAP
ncbi:MAG TPA: hypothetical protein VHJ20_11875 [Polyangia bacterium]|nr:hypothetical protein [Polyangia bacterium]